MIYIRAGLYGEGPTDYHFLLPLLDRLLAVLAAELYPGDHDVGASIGIDAPRGTAGGRAEKIAAAIHDRWDECTLFVIHADGAGDPERARSTQIDPGIAAARDARPDRRCVTAPCVPVRELEAWMLTDPEVFRALCGAPLECPPDPEREIKPKDTLRRLLAQGGQRRAPERLYNFFGEQVRLEALAALPAFHTFRQALTRALHELSAAP